MHLKLHMTKCIPVTRCILILFGTILGEFEMICEAL